MCLVLASHIGHGWKGWDRGAVSCMSFSLWQGKDCWDGRLCEVVILGMAYDAGMKLILAFVFLFWLYFYFNFFCRLAAEINVERKKGQKAKSKSSEGRKQLSSVRVIQRNLVYIVGLPLNLADEDVVPLSLSLCHVYLVRLVEFFEGVHDLCFSFQSFMQLLQHREYFGQYGKVLKVSMSRTAAGVIQQFPNNTCSV